MDQVATQATGTSAAKLARQRFGIHGTPVPATKVYVKDMAFDHDGVSKNSDGTTTERIETKSWIVITPDGRRCHLNTYNGNVGPKVDPAAFTYDMLPTKEMNKKLRKYKEVDISECPFAIAAAASAQSEAPKAQEPTGAADTQAE